MRPQNLLSLISEIRIFSHNMLINTAICIHKEDVLHLLELELDKFVFGEKDVMNFLLLCSSFSSVNSYSF